MSRRIAWINHCIPRLELAPSHPHWTSWLEQERAKFFPQNAAFNLIFLLIAGTSNILTMFLLPGRSIIETLSGRIGPLLLVNMNILFLTSFRHSVFIELAAAYQPEFVWAHQALGTITLIQMTAYFGLQFRGLFLSPTGRLSDSPIKTFLGSGHYCWYFQTSA